VSDGPRRGVDEPLDEAAMKSELASGAAAEAARLADIVDTLEQAAAQAAMERSLVADWPAERLEALRTGLRQPRFGDEEGIAAELAEARVQFDAVQDLRRRLRGVAEDA
jgi:hypothetical protein